jgi:hypothetical protein
MNHSLESNAHGYLDTNNNQKCFILKSKDSIIKKNDQIYVTYGCHDNKTLLIEYGFVLDNNPNDRIEFQKEYFEKIFKK